MWRRDGKVGAHVGRVWELEGGKRIVARSGLMGFGGKGEGEKWMREIEKERKREEGKGKEAE